jgi:hypothetical protein
VTNPGQLSGFVLQISIFMMNETPIHKLPNALRVSRRAHRTHHPDRHHRRGRESAARICWAANLE